VTGLDPVRTDQVGTSTVRYTPRARRFAATPEHRAVERLPLPERLRPRRRRGTGGRSPQRLLDRRPSAVPELATPSHAWTLRRLARYMEAVHGAGVAEATIYTALSRAGFRRGRTKLSVTSPDPQYEAKRRRIEALGKGPDPRS
jgi:hypothetical protein